MFGNYFTREAILDNGEKVRIIQEFNLPENHPIFHNKLEEIAILEYNNKNHKNKAVKCHIFRT